jgi:hypothetical protein
MTRYFQLSYPFLFAAFPVLFIAHGYPVVFGAAEIIETTAAIVVPCAAVYGLLALLPWRHASSHMTAAAVFALVVWFYAYASAYRWVEPRATLVPWHVILVPVGILATIAGLWWLSRPARMRERLATFLSLSGSMLVVWNGTMIAVESFRGHRALQKSVLARQLAAPMGASGQRRSRENGPQRDIILILLDEHASATTVREVTGFDSRPFEDSLRRLGFTVPRVVHNNYAHTMLSLPSFLNFTHLTALTAELGRQATGSNLPDHLLQSSRSARFLQSEGYEFVFFPSQWWPATRHMELADTEIAVWPAPSIRQWGSRGLARQVWARTVLSLIAVGRAEDADFVRRTVAALKSLPTGDRPRFVFAHVLSPHEPYVLDRDCRTRVAPRGAVRAAYAEQLECIDRMMLDLVRVFLARSKVPPIILLQGDHGTGFLGFAKQPSAERVSAAQARERFGAFGAYYLPEGGGREIGDTLTLVNVFPKVFKYYFRTDLPMASDDLFISVDKAPFEFRRIEPRTIARR